MNRTAGILAISCTATLLSPLLYPQSNQLRVTVKNDLDIARASETVVLASQDILKFLKVEDWKTVHLSPAGTKQELLIQAVDTNGDGAVDLFLFQSDFRAGESKSFLLRLGEARVPARDQFKAYGRFVRERYDDFAWENDRVAHRMYGLALETWQAEPLTSSAVDVWCKRVRRLVINDWYLVDNYHTDTGEGGDFYSAGKSRGCGGSGIWENGQLYTSSNFIQTRVIANGPIRVIFELTYPSWDVNGRAVSEIKRVSLDAGQNLNRFESYYETGQARAITYAAGIKQGEGSAMRFNRNEGWLRTWEPLQRGKYGNLGCGLLLDPAAIVNATEADGNYLVIARAAARQPAVYYAGFGWDRSGDFSGIADWEAYLQQFAKRLRAPLQISIAPE